MSHGTFLVLAHLAFSLFVTTVSASDPKAQEVYRKQISPVLTSHCYKCHGPDDQEGNLRLDKLDPDMLSGNDIERWQEVLSQLQLGEMPPKDAKPISLQQRESLSQWLSTELKAAAKHHRNETAAVLRRLTRYEFGYTLTDLLGVEMDHTLYIPNDLTSEDSLQNNASLMTMSSMQLDLYNEAISKALSVAIAERPRPETRSYEVDYTQPAPKRGSKKKKPRGPVRAPLPETAARPVYPGSYPLNKNGEDTYIRQGFKMPWSSGRFRVRIKASGVPSSTGSFPRMQTLLGIATARTKTLDRLKEIGAIEVKAKHDEPQTYEFTGLIDDFPQHTGAGKFSGIKLWIFNPTDYPGAWMGEETPPVLLVHSFEFECPIAESWPPESHVRILPETNQDKDSQGYVRGVIEQFLPRAYRRPVEPREVDAVLKVFQTIRKQVPSFESAVRETLAAVLASPKFLYLAEPSASDDDDSPQPLSNYELASRLSYFLWCSMPDEELFQLAARKTLSNPDVLRAQVKRMLADPKARRLSDQFATQWLGLDELYRVAVNPEYFPDYDLHLKDASRNETLAFFYEIFSKDLSCLNFLDSDFAMLNERLARHYGIEGLHGGDFKKCMLRPEDHRGGLLAHSSVLTANADGVDTHPIKRGVWILNKLLDNPPPAPPEMPAFDADSAEFKDLTLKEKLEVHRNNESCASCHTKIDPWGVALENYDAVGSWRTQIVQGPKQSIRTNKKRRSDERSKKAGNKKTRVTPVDAAAELYRGPTVTGLAELKSYLRENHQEQFAEAFTRRFLAYALCRSLDYNDQPMVEKLTQEFRRTGFLMRPLIEEIVLSNDFTSK